jgi:hypothetical protein
MSVQQNFGFAKHDISNSLLKIMDKSTSSIHVPGPSPQRFLHSRRKRYRPGALRDMIDRQRRRNRGAEK